MNMKAIFVGKNTIREALKIWPKKVWPVRGLNPVMTFVIPVQRSTNPAKKQLGAGHYVSQVVFTAAKIAFLLKIILLFLFQNQFVLIAPFK